MKITKSNQGFTAVHALLLLVLLGIIGFTGWKVYDAGKSADTTSSSTVTPTANRAQQQPPVSTIPEGFVEYKNEELGLNFAYPKEWGEIEKSEFSNEDFFSAGFSATRANAAVTGQPGYNVGIYAKTGKEGIPLRGGALWDCVGYVMKDQKYTCRNLYVKDSVSVERNDSVLSNPKLIKAKNTETLVGSYDFFGQPIFSLYVNLKSKYYGAVFVTDNSNAKLVLQLEQVAQTIELL